METLIPDWTLDFEPNDHHINYFKKRGLPFTEEAMIYLIKNSMDRFDLYWAMLALRKIGTIRSIDCLKNIVCYKNRDIQGGSVLTIAKLANGAENEFLGRLLLNKEYQPKNKWYAMVAVFYKPNADALPYALEYGINKIKSGKNLPDAGGLVLTYLARYAPENEQSKKIFSKVNKDYQNLDPKTQKCLAAEFPSIFGAK